MMAGGFTVACVWFVVELFMLTFGNKTPDFTISIIALGVFCAGSVALISLGVNPIDKEGQ